VIVEANHESRDEIEFLSKIGKRSESFDSLHYTSDAKQVRNFRNMDKRSISRPSPE
jgi:hypothetical protein